MPLDIPAPVPIDRSCAGVLDIALPILGHFLRLPAGQEVVDVRMFRNHIALLIEGTGMPARTDSPTPVMIILQTEFRDRDGGRDRRTMAHWEHAPESPWVIYNWEPAP